MNRDTSGEEARREAVAEMLLRLRWDDKDHKARRKLAAIVGRIWDALEGVDLTEKPPLSSALWLDDAGDDDLALAAPSEQPPAIAEEEEICKSTGEVAAPEVFPGTTHNGADSGHAASDSSDGAMAVPMDDDFIVVDSAMPSMTGHTGEQEKRTARDGNDYSRAEFLAHYGLDLGEGMWAEAAARSSEFGAAAEEDARNRTYLEGDDDWHARAEAARAAMDEGLQTALDSISGEVRQRMDAFASDAVPGNRLKLPLNLTAKQRKAIHLWAEMEGLSHKSFGYRGRRRLHLSATMIRHRTDDADAWASDEEQDEDAATSWD